MIIPKYAWKIRADDVPTSPGVTKIRSKKDGGLPNFDDGFYQGIPLGGFGAGTITQTYRGDFAGWHLEVGKHTYKTVFSCQFGFYENGKAFILSGYKPSKGDLPSWKFLKPNATYHALYPRAYFEYHDLNIIQEQFSPIIPHNYRETSFPVAVFRWHIFNPEKKERNVSLFWSFESMLGSKKNIFYKGRDFSGIIFDNTEEIPNHKFGQLGIFVQNNNVKLSYITSFDSKKEAKEIWKRFSTNGELFQSKKISEVHNLPGALAAKVSIKPKENKIITFVLAWDYPILESGFGTKWFKQYTKSFGNSGKNVTKIAREAFKKSELWLQEIKKWQRKFLKINKPDWFKTMLINELYYLALAGTIWTHGKVRGLKQEHFGTLECFDYPFYETLDVRFYGSFPLLKLWPRLEKLVMRDYCKTINVQDLKKVFFNHPLVRTYGERKLKGAAPHDLGAPFEDPFLVVNSYQHVNINYWKDLNSKFVLLIYRDFYLTGKKDIKFLKTAWKPVVDAIKYLKKFDRDGDCLIENDNLPDQTYDNWTMFGPSTYCNGLWLAALQAAVKIGNILKKDTRLFKKWLKGGKKDLEKKLWNGKYYMFDMKSRHSSNVMADQLCGQWYADLLDLGDIFERKKVRKALRQIFKLNVKKVGGGKIGAINGIRPDGELLPYSKIWKNNTQSNEVWVGVTFGLSSLMELRGLKSEAMKTAYGIYNMVYKKKGYWFRTPEAWDVKGNFRASMYHRPGAIWAFVFH